MQVPAFIKIRVNARPAQGVARMAASGDNAREDGDGVVCAVNEEISLPTVPLRKPRHRGTGSENGRSGHHINLNQFAGVSARLLADFRINPAIVLKLFR